MGCNCGGTADGFVAVWRYQEPGKAPRDFASQADAEAARRAAGGRGHLLRVTKRKPQLDGAR